MSVNKVILVGRIGHEPELKYTPNGNPVCTFSLATSEKWKDKNDQKQEKTEWHRVVSWSKLAENCAEYLNKGSMIYLEGALSTRSWEDKDGVKRYSTEIIADTVRFLDTRQKDEREETGSSKKDLKKEANPRFSVDEIPF